MNQMKTILVLGAGRSSASLITYLLKESQRNNWRVVIADADIELAQTRIVNAATARAVSLNANDKELLSSLVTQADVVISLLPPAYHPQIASCCLEFGKHLLTASYVSDSMKALHVQALKKELLFLNECGLDPGIDHMSAMQIIDKVKEQGGTLFSFESFTGGLIAPETDPENPWRYKFTWNPLNVVTAGQGTAKFLQEGRYKYIPYQQLFTRTTPVHVPGYGDYEGYANRDSLSYIQTYGLQGIKTMLRGTLRFKGFCSAWNVLVQLGCCDNTYIVEGAGNMTHYDFIESFLDTNNQLTLEEKLIRQCQLQRNGIEMKCLEWSGFFSREPVGIENGTPAGILQHILNKRWNLNPHDKDMIVMWHRFRYEQEGKQNEIQASLVVKGEDAANTAMAKTVGWPLGIAAKLLLLNKIKQRGVVLPVKEEFYNPILEELAALGVVMREQML